jgi:hypothetical protein
VAVDREGKELKVGDVCIVVGNRNWNDDELALGVENGGGVKHFIEAWGIGVVTRVGSGVLQVDGVSKKGKPLDQGLSGEQVVKIGTLEEPPAYEYEKIECAYRIREKCYHGIRDWEVSDRCWKLDGKECLL